MEPCLSGSGLSLTGASVVFLIDKGKAIEFTRDQMLWGTVGLRRVEFRLHIVNIYALDLYRSLERYDEEYITTGVGVCLGWEVETM